MRSKQLLEIVPAKFQVNAAISAGANPKKVGKMLFLQHFTVFKKNSHPNIFLLSWGERGALSDIQTSGHYGRAFFFTYQASPIEWKDQTQEAAKSDETFTKNPDLYKNQALLTLMS